MTTPLPSTGAFTGWDADGPVTIATVARLTGLARETVLTSFVADGDRLIVVLDAPRPPAWVRDIERDPNVTARLAGEPVVMAVARKVQDAAEAKRIRTLALRAGLELGGTVIVIDADAESPEIVLS